jgi:hypothetical protein
MLILTFFLFKIRTNPFYRKLQSGRFIDNYNLYK